MKTTKAQQRKIELLKARYQAEENGLHPAVGGAWYFEMFNAGYIFRVYPHGSVFFVPRAKDDQDTGGYGNVYYKRLDMRKPLNYRAGGNRSYGDR
jgi:hypothetical protein